MSLKADGGQQIRNSLRIAYLSGPVDAVEVYDGWSAARPLGYFGTSYLSEFFELCRDLGAEGYVITTRPGQFERRQCGEFLIENRPAPFALSGLMFHAATLLWFVRFLPTLLRFRPDAFVITAFQNYWFLLSFLKSRTLIIPALHCTLWPKYKPVQLSWRILLGLNRRLYESCAKFTIAASEDIVGQLRSLLKKNELPIAVFLPSYQPGQFGDIPAPDVAVRPFRVFFAGRIETYKGIYHLEEIARRLNQLEPGKYHFDVCGEGPELGALRQKISEDGISDVMICHGYCERSKMTALLAQSHMVIAPTTSQFEEGFNMVCAEAILAGRPLVTSPVCPALHYVRQAAVEVPPDDVDAYFGAIQKLANDRDCYQRLQSATGPLQEQFYDRRNSWGAKLRKVIMENLAPVHS